jgi:hypothetical protein
MVTFTLVFSVVIVVAVLALWAVLAGTATRRTQRVRTAFPNSVVLQGGTGTALQRVLDQWAEGPVLPLFFSLVADASGVSFWRDAHTRIDSIDWAHVRGEKVVLVRERGRFTRGIQLTIKSHAATFDLPIIVLGAGPFGSLPLANTDLDEVCRRFEALRLMQADGREAPDDAASATS